MEAGFVALIAVVVIVVFMIQHHVAKGSDREWDNAAEALGLLNMKRRFFSGRHMFGDVEGLDVRVRTVTRGSGKHSQTYTRYEITNSESIDLGLRLTKQGFFTGVAKFFGSQDIEVGDRAFDDKVQVKGRDPERIEEFLTPARRSRIIRAFSTYSGLEITDDGLAVERQGVDKAHSIRGTIQRLIGISHSLAGGAEEDAPLTRSIEARRRGDLDQALAEVESAQAQEGPTSTDAHAQRGELLYLAGRHEEAADEFRAAGVKAVEDPEIDAWAVEAGRAAASPPAEPPPAVSNQEPQTEDPEPLCRELFGPGTSSLTSIRAFDEGHAGRRARFRGRIRRAEGFNFDFILGSDPGTRLVVELASVEGAVMGSRTVQGVIALPEGLESVLSERSGEEIVFEGVLTRLDYLGRNIYLTKGRLVE